MLTRKPSTVTDDAQGGRLPFNSQELPSDYALVPPTLVAGQSWEGGEPESCRLVSVNLSAYLDDELDPDQAQLVTEHLNMCAGCAGLLATMAEMDETMEREWRESTPLPSSSQVRSSVDAIMDALPPAPAEHPTFAPRRIHARTRWIRFATGVSSFILAAGLLWSSYRLGFAHGRNTTKQSPFAISAFAQFQPALSLSSLTAPPRDAPRSPTRLTFARERRFQQ
jgi:anti-sigma factor RsiW